MFRTTLLALAATAGLIGTTEFSSNAAQAETIIRIGNHRRNGVVVVNGYRPVVVRPTYIAPSVYYPAPPIVVTPVVPVTACRQVYVRDCSTGPWVLYGTYTNQSQLYNVETTLRTRGIEFYDVQH